MYLFDFFACHILYRRSLKSIQGDLLPLLVKKQFQKPAARTPLASSGANTPTSATSSRAEARGDVAAAARATGKYHVMLATLARAAGCPIGLFLLCSTSQAMQSRLVNKLTPCTSAPPGGCNSGMHSCRRCDADSLNQISWSSTVVLPATEQPAESCPVITMPDTVFHRALLSSSYQYCQLLLLSSRPAWCISQLYSPFYSSNSIASVPLIFLPWSDLSLQIFTALCPRARGPT